MSKEILLSDWVYRLVRWVYVFLFLYAGIKKLFRPELFAVVIEAFGLVPEGLDFLIVPAALALPVVEIMAAIGLLFDLRGSLGLVAGLLLFFLAVVSYGLWMGLDIDCGCFGPGDIEGEVYHGLRPTFYRNILLLLGVAYLYYWRFSRSMGPVGVRPLFQKLLYKEER